jgi:type I restriction enzyme R subunit
LDKYEEHGLLQIEKGSVLKVKPLNELGSPVQLVRAFGGKEAFENAMDELENEIYQTA